MDQQHVDVHVDTPDYVARARADLAARPWLTPMQRAVLAAYVARKQERERQ